MPRKNSVKTYLENGYYHIYNRGVAKQDVFLEHNDYLYFLHILKSTLSKAPNKGPTLVGKRSWPQKNFFQKIDLLAYCLMPNHFHLLVRQTAPTIISEFIKSVCSRYGMYFNKKYERVGPLFQGIFKAVNIDNENYLLWMARYIHRNPTNFKDYKYSSYNDYFGLTNTSWVNTKIVLDYFSNNQAFIEFTEDTKNESKTDINMDFYSLESETDEPNPWLKTI
ncbi:MAG: transposase [Patescibacteria group bacterium]